MRIKKPRQIIKHEILRPKVELEEKKWVKVKGRYKFGRSGKKWKEEREFALRKRMLQNQSTV